MAENRVNLAQNRVKSGFCVLFGPWTKEVGTVLPMGGGLYSPWVVDYLVRGPNKPQKSVENADFITNHRKVSKMPILSQNADYLVRGPNKRCTHGGGVYPLWCTHGGGVYPLWCTTGGGPKGVPVPTGGGPKGVPVPTVGRCVYPCTHGGEVRVPLYPRVDGCTTWTGGRVYHMDGCTTWAGVPNDTKCTKLPDFTTNAPNYQIYDKCTKSPDFDAKCTKSPDFDAKCTNFLILMPDFPILMPDFPF